MKSYDYNNHEEIKLGISHNEKFGESLNIWKFKNTFQMIPESEKKSERKLEDILN